MFENLRKFFSLEPNQQAGAGVLTIIVAIISSMFGAGDVTCGGANDLIVLLNPVEGVGEGNQVAICIVDGKDDNGNPLYVIEDYVDEDQVLDLDSENLPEYKRFDVHTYMSYFKITKDDQVVTEFPKGIEIYVFYSEQGVKGIQDRTNGLARVAALDVNQAGILGNWDELGGTTIKKFDLPGILPNPFVRVVVFKYFRLPDPLIGGC